MAYTLKELRSVPDEELIAKHGERAPNVWEGLDYYLRELERRDRDRLDKQMLAHTVTMMRLTWIIGGLTVANLMAAVVVAIRA
jgi:hypothetical protein